MSAKLKIVYMGTPDFAVLPLAKIIAAGHHVKAVVTAPDRPAGRGRKLKPSAVKLFALENNLPVLQPEKLRNPEFIEALKALEADVFVVVAFRMLPEVVWQLPKLGTFNLHASLLPQYRGAAPINWAIINGEDKTGVSTFFINEEIDAGALLLQKEVLISKTETAGSLHDKLMETGADLVVETIGGLADQSLQPAVQHIAGDIKMAPKIFKEDCRIDWQKPGIQIERLIRGLSPYPGAFTKLAENGDWKNFKILEAKFEPTKHENQLNTLHVQGKDLVVWVADGFLKLDYVQPEGKRAMKASDFINGMADKQAILLLD